MSEDKKKSGFSVYWIYALAGVAFIAIQLFYSSESRITIVRKQTLFELVDSSGIEKITIINDQRANFQLNGRGLELVKTFKKGEFPKIWKQLQLIRNPPNLPLHPNTSSPSSRKSLNKRSLMSKQKILIFSSPNMTSLGKPVQTSSHLTVPSW